MHLATEAYLTQAARWPAAGRHILAQFDADTIVVYQAFQPETGRYAAAHDAFGPGFSLSRMSWIKPNFLWMMYRSGWGTKPGQECVLAIWLRRAAFETILGQAVPSSHDSARYATRADWQAAVAGSDVRLQWDPDHDPAGQPLARRAIQLGLRGATLAHYAREWIVQIEDITPFVHAQQAQAHGNYQDLITPRETVFSPADAQVAARLGPDSP